MYYTEIFYNQTSYTQKKSHAKEISNFNYFSAIHEEKISIRLTQSAVTDYDRIVNVVLF